ncbi:MAG: S41 family peptidase [Burkholderiales bacterium]
MKVRIKDVEQMDGSGQVNKGNTSQVPSVSPSDMRVAAGDSTPMPISSGGAAGVIAKSGAKLKAAGLVSLGTVLGVSLSLHFSAVAERQPAIANLPIEEVRMLSEVFGRVKAGYVEEVDDKRLIKEAINGMLTGLDPHSAFLDPDAYKDLQTATSGKFGGLGIEVGIEEGFVKVISPIDDTPAYKAGIKSGDFILKVNDTNLRGLSLTEAVKRMRGEAGSDAVLTILRRGEAKELVFNVKRAVIEIQSVRSRQLEPGIAYVRIAQFEQATAEKLVRVINDAYKQNDGNVRGMILDLRNDPGGVLEAAVAVSAAFLPKDARVVYTEGRMPDAKMNLVARKEDYQRRGKEDVLAKLNPAVKTVPLVVLVNNGTASAAEIVAGALQDHKRALVMGIQTFGKGSVQTILPISDNTAIKLTTARYFTPNGRSIQAKGIVPDKIVDDGSQRFMMREADLERHLTSEEEKKAIDAIKTALPDQKKSADTVAAKKDDEKPVDYKPAKGADGLPIDFVLQQALNHFNGQVVSANPREWLALTTGIKAKPVAAVAAATPVAADAKSATAR